MKTFKNKIICAALVAAFSGPALADCKNFSRAIVATHDRSASIVLNAFDFSSTGVAHEQMRTKLGYTQAQTDNLDTSSIAYFQAQLGLNFAASFPVPVAPGIFGKGVLLPGSPLIAVLIPYINGQNAEIPVIFDSKNGTNKIFNVESGNLVIFLGPLTGTGTIPGGLHAGANIQYFDNFFYGNIDLVKKKPDGSFDIKENFFTTSDQIAKTPRDSLGAQQFIITLNMTDENGKVGRGDSMTTTDKFELDGVTLNPAVRLRNVYTWPCSE